MPALPLDSKWATWSPADAVLPRPEQEVFWHGVDLFKLDVDLVFYDATTAWFECGDEDVAPERWRGLTFAPLRKRGHSKEGRDNDPQVIIALAVTRDGVPVRSWVPLPRIEIASSKIRNVTTSVLKNVKEPAGSAIGCAAPPRPAARSRASPPTSTPLAAVRRVSLRRCPARDR